MNDISNLIDLKILNIDTILEVLQDRYLKNNIYTKINQILLALNPFKKVQLNKDQPHPDDIALLCLTDLRKNKNNHSILVSGESGAGKTETTKIILKKLLDVNDNKQNEKILEQIYWSNYILESFGNAKTIRNHNSSRFGKYINIYYDDNNQIVGGKIETYLLEKIRITKKSIDERNYHIFYQLFPDLINESILKTNNLIDENLDDESSKFELFQAFKYFDIQQDMIDKITNILKVIIYLGNFNKYKKQISLLLNISLDKLTKNIEGKTIKVGSEIIYKKLKPEEIQVKIETFQQELYLSLFNYLVNIINKELTKNLDNKIEYHFIGILDIFGFEILQNNSIEQLCINYTNEVLQNTFNKYFFEKEQELYISEGLPFDLVQFENNDNIINKLENELFSEVNEVTKFIKGSDKQIMERVFKTTDEIIEISNLEKTKMIFNINHYADKVQYNLEGFLEKNKLDCPNELIELLDNCFLEINSTKDKLLSSFQKQINLLKNKINSTQVNFIRCLKPNDEMIPLKINSNRTTQQLKYNGVMEAIRVARQGYPIRIKNDIFNKLYGLIPKNEIEWLIQGKTLTFLNREQEVILDNKRIVILNKYSTNIQSIFRGYMCKKLFISKKILCIKIQSLIRGKLQRIRYIKLLQNYKANIIRKYYLMYKNYKLFRNIIFINRWIKFRIHWNQIILQKKNKASSIITKYIKKYYLLNKLSKFITHINIIKGFTSIIVAKKERIKLRKESKDFVKIKDDLIRRQKELEQELEKQKQIYEENILRKQKEQYERIMMENEEREQKLIELQYQKLAEKHKREELDKENNRLVRAIGERDIKFINELNKMQEEMDRMRQLLKEKQNSQCVVM